MEKIVKTTDGYGFDRITITTEKGGRINITDYGKGEDSDIGLFSVLNEHGLGGSNYIRSRSRIDSFIKRVKNIVWISQEAEKELIKFLEGMKQGS